MPAPSPRKKWSEIRTLIRKPTTKCGTYEYTGITREEVFHRYYDRRGPRDCWPWTRSLVNGYGSFILGGRRYCAHQLAWMIHNKKDIPENMHVLHSCDTPSCVNHGHLSLGTHSRNIKESFDRDRSTNRGEANPCHKLTEEQAAEVYRQAWSGKIVQVEIAARFGISQSQVSNVKLRKAWRSSLGGGQ